MGQHNVGLWFTRIRRGFNRTPVELYYRLVQELRASFDRFRGSPVDKINNDHFLKLFGTESIADLWSRLSERPYVTEDQSLDQKSLHLTLPGEFERIINVADATLEWRVDILGSGPTTISSPLNWRTDFKVGLDWPVNFFRDIDILNVDRPSDVKIPWELSRLQWLIPVGQAYRLTGNEKYSDFCREILADWIQANPYGRGVNWAIAMEPAMRIFVWTWLFQMFKNASGWSDSSFRFSFLRCLYEHGIFVERYLEDFGLNGNHCTADAGALVFAGLFFGEKSRPLEWQNKGWKLLLKELPRQVFDDGVNFEGSTAYHRFACELFFWPAKFRLAFGKEVPEYYSSRVLRMANFIESYTKPNSLVPLWGDTDDGRVLPFGGESLNDHSYLVDLVRLEWSDDKNSFATIQARAEILWTYGVLDYFKQQERVAVSRRFKDSGFYIMATQSDHIFIDCGPVGFNGKGGHGHNDCLSFEAVLDGVPLISDSGSYVYSASYKDRNAFRSTLAHNTPVVDGQEQNRLISEMELFSLQNDAVPDVLSWETADDVDMFIGSHSGFQRLSDPVVPVRTIILERNSHRLIVKDEFKGEGLHSITVPLHLEPGCQINKVGDITWLLHSKGKSFNLVVCGTTDWAANIVDGKISPSYGKVLTSSVIEFSHEGSLETLIVGIYPVAYTPKNPALWLEGYL